MLNTSGGCLKKGTFHLFPILDVLQQMGGLDAWVIGTGDTVLCHMLRGKGGRDEGTAGVEVS